MKILVTGVSGFIGGRIATHLKSQGYEVVTSARRAPADRLADLTNAQECEGLTKGCTVVINCAGKAGAWGSYKSFWLANVLSTENLLAASRRSGVQKFIHLSSPSIYFAFHDQLNLKEDYLPPRHSNHYARTKYESEQLVLKAHSRDIQTIALRPRLVIGAGDTNVLPRLVAAQKEAKLFDIGSRDTLVSVTSISNLLHAIDCCLKAPAAAFGEAYNIADAKPLSFHELTNKVLQSMKLPLKRRHISRPLALTLARLNALFCRVLNVQKEPRILPVPVAVLSQSMTLNIEKAKSRLGYSPQDKLDNEIREFAQWWESRSRNKH